MKSPDVAASAGPGLDTARWAARVYAACLVLFPLVFFIFAGTDIHPDPSGETPADQVRAVAESAGAWQLVHLLLGAGSLLAMGAVLALRSLVPTRRSRLYVAALGWVAKSVRPWEALAVIVGVVGIYATNTILHGDAKYGLVFVLVAGASIAYRMQRRSRHG